MVSRRPGETKVDAVVIVAGDDVARAGRRPSYRVARRTLDQDTVAEVAQIRAAADVRADEIALNLVPRRDG